MRDRRITSVLFVVDRWVPGGVKRHIRDLSVAFRARGIKCTIAGWLPPGEKEPASLGTFLNLPLYDDNNNKSLIGFARSVAIVEDTLRDRYFDIIHMHARYVTPIVVKAIRNINLHRVYTSHSIFRNIRFLPWYPRQVICLNQIGKEHFTGNYFLPNDVDITVVPNGIDIELDICHPHPCSNAPMSPYTFSFIGRLERCKGVDLVLKAAAELPKTEFRIEIAGSGPEESVLRSLAHHLRLDDKVRFHGHLENPKPLLERSLALIVPSRELEGFGYVVLEAFSRYCPVIASDMTVFDETVQEGTTGLRFKTGDHSSLASVMRRVLDRPDQMKVMGENGNILLNKKFSLDQMIDSTLGVYKKAMGI